MRNVVFLILFVDSSSVLYMLALLIFVSTLTVSADFVKHTERCGKREDISGFFYFFSSSDYLYWVEKPVKQIMLFRRDTLLIFYPDDTVAFRFINIHTRKEAVSVYGLDIGELDKFMNAGYVPVRKETRQDTIYYYLVPTEQNKNETVIIGEFNEKVFLTEITSGKVVRSLHYLKYLNHDGHVIPTDMIFKQIVETDTLIERMVYSNFEFNPDIPDSIRFFRFPESIEVKEVLW